MKTGSETCGPVAQAAARTLLFGVRRREFVTGLCGAFATVLASRRSIAEAADGMVVDKEREIASQSDALKGKPAAAMEGILKGKLNKYFETNCLLEQGFVKNPDLKVEAHLGAVGKQLGDSLTIRRFLRFQLQSDSRGSGVGIAEIQLRPPAFGASLNAFFQSIAAESPTGTYPKYLLDRQTYWTIVGAEGDDDEALIKIGRAHV